MEHSQLQKVAEQVIDVEARIINWDGSITEWARDLIRLRVELKQLVSASFCMKDTAHEEFLKCLMSKTNRCWENVLSRARRITEQQGSVTFIDEIYTKSGEIAEFAENQYTK